MSQDEKLVSTLKQMAIFKHLSEAECEEMATKIRLEFFAKDFLIFADGSEADGLYIIKTGKVRILQKNASGIEEEIAVLTDNDFFGEMALISEKPRIASAVAATDTLAFMLKKQDFQALLGKNLQIATQVGSVIKQRAETNIKRKQQRKKTARLTKEESLALLYETTAPANPIQQLPQAIRHFLQKLPQYEYCQTIGEGAMGKVLMVRHKSLGCLFALKLLHTDSSAANVSRFLREAKILAMLSKANQKLAIPAIYDFAQLEEFHYYIMEYIEGESLKNSISQGKISLERALKITISLAELLASLHAKGIVHRDIKPANILLEKNNQKVYLVDFGMAKAWEEAVTEESLMGNIGTLRYTPPEMVQTKDTGSPVGDIYSLGAVLYEMLTLQPAIPGDNHIQIFSNIVNFITPPPSSIMSHIDSQLDEICLKALQKEPAQRYASAEQFKDELQRYQQSKFMQATQSMPEPPKADNIHEFLATLEGYELRKKLGQGGMGVVFQVYNKTLGRLEALKLLLQRKEQGISDNELKRFTREAQTLARLKKSHPGLCIPSVYEAGQRGEFVYYTMDFVEGMSLQKIIENERAKKPSDRLTLPQIVGIIRDLAQTLSVIHQEGVLHRDIKPGNVIIEQGTGKVYLVDFGLVKKTSGDEDLTGQGVVGTLLYMAPEQVRDKAIEQSDVYALGAMLYELLTLRPVVPVCILDPRLVPPKMITNMVIQDILHRPPLPPRKLAKKLHRRLDKELEAITLKALAKPLDKRHANAAELQKDLDKYLSRRRRTPWLLLVLAALLAMLFMIVRHCFL